MSTISPSLAAMTASCGTGPGRVATMDAARAVEARGCDWFVRATDAWWYSYDMRVTFGSGFDVRELRRTSDVEYFPWLGGLVTLVRITSDGVVSQAKTDAPEAGPAEYRR